MIHQRYRQTDRVTDGHAISIPRYALVHRAAKTNDKKDLKTKKKKN